MFTDLTETNMWYIHFIDKRLHHTEKKEKPECFCKEKGTLYTLYMVVSSNREQIFNKLKVTGLVWWWIS